MGATARTYAQTPVKKRPTKSRLFWLRFRRNRLAVAALCFITVEVLVALFAPWVAPYDPYRGDFTATWQTPNGLHWLGTDDLGRDVLSRLIYGARVSVSVGVLSQLVIALVGFRAARWAG